MIRLLIYFAAIIAAAVGLSWLADQPGSIQVTWQGIEYSTSIFVAVVALALLVIAVLVLWSIFTGLLSSPAAILQRLRRRREKLGMNALSRGMIAVGAGDVRLARKYAQQAARNLSGDPMSALLRAQAAQLSGDRQTVQRIYEAMLETPETELLGLRGLFNEASREHKLEAARQYAERALERNGSLVWAAEGLLNLQCRERDWAGALATLGKANFGRQVDRARQKRWKAALLTARAQEIEDEDPETALQYALDAHTLAPDLVPAAELAGHLLANAGNPARAGQVIRKTWRLAPHPDLATVYAYLRQGDSPRDRLARIMTLYSDLPSHPESMIAAAHAAIEARDWKQARRLLKPLLDDKPTGRVCTLMARIEGGEFGDKGRVREWLARALKAPRDPVWIADSHISDSWEPVSPVSGRLDAYEWRVPDQTGHSPENDLILDDLMSLPALSTQSDSTAVVAVDPMATDATSSNPTSVADHAAAREQAKSALANGSGTSPEPPARRGSPASDTTTEEKASETAISLPPPDDPGPDYQNTEQKPERKLDPPYPPT